MADNVTPVRHRLGRRGAALLTLGIIWVLSGINDILDHPRAVPGYWLYSNTPWWLQAAGWIVTGLVACWAAFQRQGRDTIGWLSVYIMGFYALAVYADAVAEAAGGPHFKLIALSGVKNFAVVGLIVILSGWREPVRFTGVTDKDSQ